MEQWQSDDTTCPRCHRSVEPEWRLCPSCEAVLLGPERGSQGGKQDEALRQGLALPHNPLAAILAVAGALGLFPVALAAEIACALWFGIFVTFILSLGIAFTLMVFVVQYRRLDDGPAKRFFDAVIVGALAFLGGVLVLSCALGAVGAILAGWLR